MPLLSPATQAKIRKHTGYIESVDPITQRPYSAVPPGYMRLFKAAVADREWQAIDVTTTIDPLIAELEELYPQRLPHKQEDGIGYRRLITGDTNRTDIEYRPESLRARKRAYIEAGNELCNLLGLPYNFKDPANAYLLNKDVIYPEM